MPKAYDPNAPVETYPSIPEAQESLSSLQARAANLREQIKGMQEELEKLDGSGYRRDETLVAGALRSLSRAHQWEALGGPVVRVWQEGTSVGPHPGLDRWMPYKILQNGPKKARLVSWYGGTVDVPGVYRQPTIHPDDRHLLKCLSGAA